MELTSMALGIGVLLVVAPSILAIAGPCSISTLSTGAQSMAWQHSIGYQSCAAAGVAAASKAAKSHFFDMPCLV